MRNLIKFLTSRLVICFVLIAAQIYFIISWMYDLALLHALTPLVELFSFLLAVVVINREEDSSFKMIWLVLILAVPIVGIVLYLLCAGRKMPKRLANGTTSANSRMKYLLRQDSEILSAAMQSEQAYPLFYHAFHSSGFPVYGNTASTYFKSGEEWYPVFLTRLREAKHFIFLEYFIVEEGMMWGRILEILVQKAKEGVDVRVMYDGTCEFSTLPHDYPARLNKLGIKCKIFGRLTPFLSTYYNYRDHRKILVIDGIVAFNGGINLADEYINVVNKYGYWKDVAVMLKGAAAKSFTLMFLQLWSIREKEWDFSEYLNVPALPPPDEGASTGFVIPYGDNPVDKNKVGECVYMDILNRAQRYVHIMSPYLILDGEMETVLKFAAERGVDVTLILPGIPDKKAPYALAKTHYASLLASGVRIYEYMPGFVHAKVFVCDNREAVIGTINLDYRSLYHHFECATYLYGVDCIGDIEADYQSVLKQCRRVTAETIRREKWTVKASGIVLKAIAPLM